MLIVQPTTKYRIVFWVKKKKILKSEPFVIDTHYQCLKGREFHDVICKYKSTLFVNIIYSQTYTLVVNCQFTDSCNTLTSICSQIYFIMWFYYSAQWFFFYFSFIPPGLQLCYPEDVEACSGRKHLCMLLHWSNHCVIYV